MLIEPFAHLLDGLDVEAARRRYLDSIPPPSAEPTALVEARQAEDEALNAADTLPQRQQSAIEAGDFSTLAALEAERANSAAIVRSLQRNRARIEAAFYRTQADQYRDLAAGFGLKLREVVSGA